jgi:hypothetical protein
VVVDIVCSSTYAEVPAQVTIPQNHLSATFPVTTPTLQAPFKPAHATIVASYSGTFTSAMLTVTSNVVAGILASLVVTPKMVPAGGVAHGTVTLVQPVPKPTIVSIAAMSTTPVPIGPLPGSQIATVPPSVTIPAGGTSAQFTITTNHNVAPGTKHNVSVVASAVTFKYAILTVTA